MKEFKPFSPEEEVIRARQALSVLQNDIFKEACELIEGALATSRARVPTNETEMHTRLILTEQLWLQLKDHIQQVADTGKWAQDAIDQKEREQQTFLRRIMSGGLRAA